MASRRTSTGCVAPEARGLAIGLVAALALWALIVAAVVFVATVLM